MEPEVRGIVNFLVAIKLLPLILNIPSGKPCHRVILRVRLYSFAGASWHESRGMVMHLDLAVVQLRISSEFERVQREQGRHLYQYATAPDDSACRDHLPGKPHAG